MAVRPSAKRPSRASTPRAKVPRSKAARVAHAREIERRLRLAYPDAHCELDHRNAYELAVATILSAQCTDKRVNLVTPEFFRRWPDAAALARAPIREIEQVIHTTGFYRNQAKSLRGLAIGLVKSHGGEIPSSMDALVKLPGIGRKTANVILGNAFGMSEGITVDTHVIRLSGRFGLTKATDAVQVERALLPLFPRESWTMLSHLMIFHGRRVCEARRPRCAECTLSDICPSASA